MPVNIEDTVKSFKNMLYAFEDGKFTNTDVQDAFYVIHTTIGMLQNVLADKGCVPAVTCLKMCEKKLRDALGKYNKDR